MSDAIWIIMYDLQPTRSTEYLDWFNQVHIPEKLARANYTWASHYQILSDSQATDDGSISCIALFGSTTTSTFYNPSPAQIKPTQSSETKDMMSCRSNSTSLIVANEWVANGNGIIGSASPIIDARVISVSLCNADGNDENFGAWLVQDHLPLIAENQQCTQVRKFLASTGNAHHGIIHEYADSAEIHQGLFHKTSNEWSDQVEGYLTYPLGSPQIAKRLWHSVSD